MSANERDKDRADEVGPEVTERGWSPDGGRHGIFVLGDGKIEDGAKETAREEVPQQQSAEQVCPECGEAAVDAPAIDLVPWEAHGQERPAWSHADGTALCPVVGERGYEPAQPDPRERDVEAGA